MTESELPGKESAAVSVMSLKTEKVKKFNMAVSARSITEIS
jgi:hypothetical protein